MSIISLHNLTKKFGAYTAVDDISLEVAAGEIFGFLGPNGAGKTTTIKMMTGLLKPDGGTIIINGVDLAAEPQRCKKNTAYIPDRPFLYEKLTGMEFLQFIASLYTLKPEPFTRGAERFLDLFDLTDWRHHLIESYSHGMRQKLIIAAAFLIEAPVVIVDEPMVGLDPKSVKIVKELLKSHCRKGGAVFLSTHSLEIAEELCDRIAIITKGRLRAVGTMASLHQEAKTEGSGLEDIFLQLTGAFELHEIIAALKNA
jgi:ABC-2 type transport system ATP-binding protein